MSEKKVIGEEIFHYLTNLGYSISQISSQVQTETNEKVDFVVRLSNNDDPWIVVELKSGSNFPDPASLTRLQFDPSVRKLQHYATILRARFYLLTDGVSFLWFETNDVGRPHLLESPVTSPRVGLAKIMEPSKEDVIQVFRNLSDYLRRYYEYPIYYPIAGVIILAQIMKEQGDNRLHKALLHTEDFDNLLYISDTLQLPLQEFPRPSEFSKAFDILDQIPLTRTEAQDVLAAIDEVFLQSLSRYLRIPRWLADFMVRLSDIQSVSVVCDIFSNVGNILAATGILDIEVQMSWGVNRDPYSAVWAKLQQIILGEPLDTIIVTDLLADNIDTLSKFKKPTRIITAPTFGGKIRNNYRSFLFSRGVRQQEDLYLEFAVNYISQGGRIVILLPEGILFSGDSRRATRQFVLEHTQITAIISLDAGALKPFAGIKTSILVLDKDTLHEPSELFMAHIDAFPQYPNKDSFNSYDIPQVADIIDAFTMWTKDNKLPETSPAWTVQRHKLDIQNFTVTRYKPVVSNSQDSLENLYPTVSLKTVLEWTKRGIRIKLDETGQVPVIGPAAIRPMILDRDSIGYTAQENLISNALTVQVNDVILNNISTHLGAAVVVGDDSAGSYVSQHVLVLRPISSKVLPEYLAAVINSGYVKSQINQRATGTVIPSLSLKQLAEITIPLPDINTQQRIVNNIKESLEKLVQAENKLKEAENEFSESITYLAWKGQEQ